MRNVPEKFRDFRETGPRSRSANFVARNVDELRDRPGKYVGACNATVA